jgi:hypothetical protein
MNVYINIDAYKVTRISLIYIYIHMYISYTYFVSKISISVYIGVYMYMKQSQNHELVKCSPQRNLTGGHCENRRYRRV